MYVIHREHRIKFDARKEGMIGYLLKAASVLKEMRITTTDFLNRPDDAVLLLSLSKACVACQVIIN